ncbi:A1 cistron-splicing factor [Chytridium lagenaria]|nr:A1 cistron-splicing factor [Chytridium lagenaria]
MFKYFAPKEVNLVAVKRWDPSTEDFLDEDKLDSSYVSGLQNALEQLDPNLGAYPFLPTPDLPEPNYQKWIRLTSNITPDVLKKVLPKSGKVNSGLSGSRFSDFGDVMQRKSTEQMILDSHDAYLINFTVIDLKRSFPVNSSPDQIMKYSLDKSFLLRSILNLEYKNDYKMLLGELQLAFLLLLVGQVYDGLEQWKTIIQLLSNSPEAMSQYDVPYSPTFWVLLMINSESAQMIFSRTFYRQIIF